MKIGNFFCLKGLIFFLANDIVKTYEKFRQKRTI